MMLRRTPLVFALFCGVSFVAGSVLSHVWWPGERPVIEAPLRAGSEKYSFINPLLLCQSYEDGEFEEFAPLKKDLERITAGARQTGTIHRGSVYLRELMTGRWVGVNEEQLYTPASLLKVPILIAYLKRAESDPELLNQRVYYKQEPGQRPPLIDTPVLASEGTYAIEDLLRSMIIDSDNTAKDILEARIDKTHLRTTYDVLGIRSPYEGSGEYQISTRAYALFFRILYNATLLNPDMSEKAFDILADVKFSKGLRAGIPNEVPIAHKYGYRIVQRTEPSVVELSDCGIVYYPEDPYLLCVMAQGSDPESTATYIRDVAAATHRFVTR
jgi:beta-lactamase class A